MAAHLVLEASYSQLVEALSEMGREHAWSVTRCRGWCAQDLVLHLLSDAQRALVALNTPASGPADTDAVSYWRSWEHATEGSDDAGLRHTRVLASVWSFAALTALYAETAQAVLVASERRAGSELVATQGKTMSVDALRSTLAVEATVHQLDLGAGQPARQGLTEVRRVLDGLLGPDAPISDAPLPGAPIPDDVRYALVGTGREPLTSAEKALIGPAAGRFPLFG